MRTFIAIKIKPEPLLLDKIDELKRILASESIKWVEEKNLHLTLKFLGEVSQMQSTQIKDILFQFTQRNSPVTVLPAGFGYFNSGGMPRVLFVKIEGMEGLQKMAEDMDDLLLPLGFEKEKRPFRPHLTLARIRFLKNKKAFYNALGLYQEILLQPVVINNIIFYQSILNPDGPVYHELGNYSLEGTG
jgi:2'-5' RNA ligase